MGGSCISKENAVENHLIYAKLGQELIQGAKKFVDIGELQKAIANYKDAIDFFTIATQTDDALLYKNLLIQSYIELADLHKSQNNFNEAKLCYETAKELGDTSVHSKLKDLVTLIAQSDKLELESTECDSSSLPTPCLNFTFLSTNPSTKKIIALKQFTDNPTIMNPREYKDLSDIKNTRELANFLTQVPKNDKEYQELKKLALSIIEAFAQREVTSKALIVEVKTLAVCENEEVIMPMLEQFTKRIRDAVLLDVNLLDGLADILRHINPELLNASDLSQMLIVIHERLKKELEVCNEEKNLLSLIQAISNLLASMADANVKGLNRVNQHEPLYKTLSELISSLMSVTSIDELFADHSDKLHVRQAALYARQALVRVPDDENKLQSAIRRLINIGQGLNALNNAFQQKSPTELFGAFCSFKEAFKFQTTQKPWYDSLRYAELLIDCNHFTGFEEFIKNSEFCMQESMLYGIVKLLKKIISTHFDFEIRCSALKLLGQLWVVQDNQHDSAVGKIKTAVNEYTSLQDGEYIGVHEGIQTWVAEIFLETIKNSDQKLRKIAIQELTELQQQLSQSQKRIFEKTIPLSYAELETVSEIIIDDSTELLDVARNKSGLELKDSIAQIGKKIKYLSVDSESIEKKLLQLKNSILNNKEIAEELATYIPVNACYQRHANQNSKSFDLKTEINQRLTRDNAKVLLLLGSAGVGKSTFNRYLEKSLWEEYKLDSAIPLFISLPTLSNVKDKLIQEYLQNIPADFSFNEQEIKFLQQNYKFIFILDGYDEINTTSNLYLTNKLENWKAKIVISCRTDYLNNIAKDDVKIFMPYIGAKPQPQVFTEMTIVPFSDTQITNYITKYLSIHKSNPDSDKNLPWGSAKEYEEHIQKIPGLKQLIRTPFLLMVAMDVMPEIVRQYEGEYDDSKKIAMTGARLLDEFVAQLFDREEDKLMVEDKLPNDGSDVKEDFWTFAMELAVAMHEMKTNDVYYAPQATSLFGKTKDQNPLERFFGIPNDPIKAERLKRARNGCNCVLRTIGKHRRTFIHATLQDYFVIRKIKLDEEQGFVPKVFTPFYSSLKSVELVRETQDLDFVDQRYNNAPKVMSYV